MMDYGGLTIKDVWPKIWSRLKRQVRGLQVPWLENMASADRDPFKVLISCILSLRTQDKTTGEASERLFSIASKPDEMARLSTRDIERAIYPVGFYKVKAKRIKDLSRIITRKYNSTVPGDIDELLKLKGIGRKTANLVITLGYNRPGICVDTHVHRITNRIGLVKTKRPEDTEMELRKIIPERYRIELNGLFVAFGQGICKPISPLCSKCSIYDYCKKVGVKKHR